MLVQNTVRGTELVFPNDDLHPLIAVLTAPQSTVGQSPFSSLSAKLSHLGRLFCLQLSECSTAHLSFGERFYPNCPTDPQVFTFLAMGAPGEMNSLTRQRQWLAKTISNVINTKGMMHFKVIMVTLHYNF